MLLERQEGQRSLVKLGIEFTVRAKSIFSRRRFRHLTQNGRAFFELHYQILATSGLSPAGPESRQHFCCSFFWQKNSAMLPGLNLNNF